MTDCDLYCGEESLWTREELDELRDALDDALDSEDIHITAMYLKKVDKDEAFDIEYHAVIGGTDIYSSLFQTVIIDPSLSPNVEKLIATYVPKLTELIRYEVYCSL
jgi:hypothetical protein